MSQRLDYATVSPESRKALLALNSFVDSLEIEPRLKALVKIRVSQINGCLFCIDMHATAARSAGESQQRLDSLIVWDEAPFFSDRERAALEWAESVTLCAETGVPDEVYLQVRQIFSEKELIDLTCLVINMNGLNRIGVSFRMEPPARTQ
ncbi:MAG: carboxymuconolactone decarboxylase family protein [Arenicellales bacterium]|jgi:AhpD family alkylhydroperoxidase|nr:carboxymuconolactone decarboxylase family protein [Arenicellales bacterium]MDP7118848.1 carboxymuconolactone decarboxylase family protein [Arenicellales bacterium]MDP7191868.1 carboxymuconolactone decarboxylase family protein [Arenicellales bacterium]MDP7490898.1 carboxymuconolactone decarboxylase family protein [Arenicellales bacterium]HJP45685.1 carboxymuconolactone decarboxylase family protein [Arenicellales bacterium]